MAICEMKILRMKLEMISKRKWTHKRYITSNQYQLLPSEASQTALFPVKTGMHENLLYLLEERFALGDTLAYASRILYIECEANQYNK